MALEMTIEICPGEVCWSHFSRKIVSQNQRKIDTRPSKINMATSKGQIISEGNCGVFHFPNNQRNIVRISAIALKMGQTSNGTLLFKLVIIYHLT